MEIIIKYQENSITQQFDNIISPFQGFIHCAVLGIVYHLVTLLRFLFFDSPENHLNDALFSITEKYLHRTEAEQWFGKIHFFWIQKNVAHKELSLFAVLCFVYINHTFSLDQNALFSITEKYLHRTQSEQWFAQIGFGKEQKNNRPNNELLLSIKIIVFSCYFIGIKPNNMALKISAT